MERVSEQDREYMRRLGAQKALSHAQALADHLALPLGERLRRSLILSARFARPGAEASRSDPLAFYERAKQLGMYEP